MLRDKQKLQKQAKLTAVEAKYAKFQLSMKIKNLKTFKSENPNSKKRCCHSNLQVVSVGCFLDMNKITGAKNESDVSVFTRHGIANKVTFWIFYHYHRKSPREAFRCLHHRRYWQCHDKNTPREIIMKEFPGKREKDHTTIHKHDLRKAVTINNR